MKIYKRFLQSFSLLILPLISTSQLNAQTSLPEVLKTGTLQEQKVYMEEKMNNYNGYRAVREDIFLTMLKNSIDSLNSAKGEINTLLTSEESLQSKIESINSELLKAKNSEEKAIKEKNSLTFLGIPLHKTTYNLILWGIIAALAFLLSTMFILFKRNFKITATLKKDLEDTREEFEVFRTNSREKQEQLVISHFNEIKKLKGGA
ncbi:MAG: hypothetical protein K9H49_04300 [Bacteroidales bacterium]|nr:hypothetical protein [Bacteroidales bacterium]MCF8390049.1 hypothetical protein [Bacteroidales bacterium]